MVDLAKNVRVSFDQEGTRLVKRAVHAIEELNRKLEPNGGELVVKPSTSSLVFLAIHEAYPGPDDPGVISQRIVKAIEDRGVVFAERVPHASL